MPRGVTTSRELERLAGAVLCVGFTGDAAARAPLDELAELGPGGIVLFSRNVTSVPETLTLVESVRASVERATGVGPFVAVDQEGGRVRRLRRGAQDIPPMMTLGATRDVALAERIGRVLGADVRAAGCDVNFAPVLDLASRPKNTVIGNRSFGDDPNVVADLGAAVVRGMASQGIAAVLKHFPGHGPTAQDTHDEAASVLDEGGCIRERDLVPFARVIAAGARCVMAAHVRVVALDRNRPASLSRAILHDVLRVELGFTGVCFTDCLEMGAIANGIGTGEAAVMAIEAGADCVILSHTPALASNARSALVEAVLTGRLPWSRLEEAAMRVRSITAASHRAPEFAADEFAAADVARRAVTIVRGDAINLRVHAPVTVVSFEPASHRGAEDAEAGAPSLALALRRRHVHAELLRVPTKNGIDVDQLLNVLRAQPSRDVVIVSRRAHLDDVQRNAIVALLDAVPHAMVVSMLEPFDAVLFPQARRVLCTYGDDAVMVEALADALTRSDAAPQGRLPVQLSWPC